MISTLFNKIIYFLTNNNCQEDELRERNNFAMRCASLFGHLHVVKYLVEQGADVTSKDNAAIEQASSRGNIKIVEYLIENGADINSCNKSIINYALANHDFKFVNDVAEKIDITDELKMALKRHYMDDILVKYLVENGVDINVLLEDQSINL